MKCYYLDHCEQFALNFSSSTKDQTYDRLLPGRRCAVLVSIFTVYYYDYIGTVLLSHFCLSD